MLRDPELHVKLTHHCAPLPRENHRHSRRSSFTFRRNSGSSRVCRCWPSAWGWCRADRELGSLFSWLRQACWFAWTCIASQQCPPAGSLPRAFYSWAVIRFGSGGKWKSYPLGWSPWPPGRRSTNRWSFFGVFFDLCMIHATSLTCWEVWIIVCKYNSHLNHCWG